MPGENLEIARRIFEATRLGPPEETAERVVALCDPEVEVVSTLSAVEGGAYHGHDGVRRYFSDQADVWREWVTEVVGLEEVDGETVLAELSSTAISKVGYGGEMPTFVLVTVSNGKARRIHSHRSREEALAAAGTS